MARCAKKRQIARVILIELGGILNQCFLRVLQLRYRLYGLIS